MNKKLLSLYGLKWNPFASDLPSEALLSTPRIDSFGWRIEQNHVREGGRTKSSIRTIRPSHSGAAWPNVLAATA